MKKSNEELVTTSAEAALYRQGTNIAGLCREIVLKSAVNIQGRSYVKVEGWMAIATAHGCIATIKSVEEISSGILAIAEIRRQSDGAILTTAEGFVGKDEPTWYGGEVLRGRGDKEYKQTLPKRLDYAIRAMAQTRAVSRACRTAFAHVVVLMDAGLDTIPAEEVPAGGFEDDPKPMGEVLRENLARSAPAPAVEIHAADTTKLRTQFEGGKWRGVEIHFGKNKGLTLEKLEKPQLHWYCTDWHPKAFGSRPISDVDLLLRAALDVAAAEETA
jgi:hypothetical protein